MRAIFGFQATMITRQRAGFSLIELLAVVAILAILAAAIFPALSGAARKADQAEAISRMRSLGVAMTLYSADHDGVMVGPLWPGQVTEYDSARAGRLIRDLASYLDIQDRTPPYVVEKFLPRAAIRALPGVAPKNIRPFVMNHKVPVHDAEISPWGNLAANPPTQPVRASMLANGKKNWVLSEAYRTHPDVAGASWRANTPPAPLFGPQPLGLFFDGSVAFFDPTATP